MCATLIGFVSVTNERSCDDEFSPRNVREAFPDSEVWKPSNWRLIDAEPKKLRPAGISICADAALRSSIRAYC